MNCRLGAETDALQARIAELELRLRQEQERFALADGTVKQALQNLDESEAEVTSFRVRVGELEAELALMTSSERGHAAEASKLSNSLHSAQTLIARAVAELGSPTGPVAMPYARACRAALAILRGETP